jgi:hypothetical protein
MLATLNSIRFVQLRKSIDSLALQLLPKKFNILGHYTELQVTKTKSFMLLAHAEIEYFIEETVREKAIESVKKFKNENIVSIPVVTLLGFLSKKNPTITEILRSSSDDIKDIRQRLDDSLGIFISTIESNHGIKTNNLLEMLLPVGIEESQLDPVWINDMDGFGSDRGLFAHKSGKSYSTTKIINPKDVLLMVKNLLIGLKELDNNVLKL